MGWPDGQQSPHPHQCTPARRQGSPRLACPASRSVTRPGPRPQGGADIVSLSLSVAGRGPAPPINAINSRDTLAATPPRPGPPGPPRLDQQPAGPGQQRQQRQASNRVNNDTSGHWRHWAGATGWAGLESIRMDEVVQSLVHNCEQWRGAEGQPAEAFSDSNFRSRDLTAISLVHPNSQSRFPAPTHPLITAPLLPGHARAAGKHYWGFTVFVLSLILFLEQASRRPKCQNLGAFRWGRGPRPWPSQVHRVP